MSFRTQSDDSEQLEELPPLDEPGVDDPEGPAEDEALPLLTPLEEDVDLDEDERAADIDLGLEVVEVESDTDEPGEVVLDMTELLSIAEEDENPDESDVSGPANLDIGADMDVDGEELLGSAEEGTDEPLEDLVSEQLPELDEDEPGGLEDEPSWLSLDALRDEDLPPRTDGWRVIATPADGADWAALCRVPDGVVAAGRTVAFLSRVPPASVPIGGTRAVAVAPVTADRVLCLTAGAELVQVGLGSEPVVMTGWRECLGVRSDESPELTLAALDEKRPGAVVVHAGRSSVAQSDDGGHTWTAAELGGALSTVSRGDAPVRLLSKTAEGHALCAHGGSGWAHQPLDRAAEEVAEGERVHVGSSGNAVAIATAERGLVVSTDGGQGFSRVPGCLHLTALTLGERAGRTKVWVGVFMESEERTLVIEVDCLTRRAAVVAEMTSPGDEPDDVDARIEALVWDPSTHTLVAACNDALFTLHPPRD